jgi:hypothetical protein
MNFDNSLREREREKEREGKGGGMHCCMQFPTFCSIEIAKRTGLRVKLYKLCSVNAIAVAKLSIQIWYKKQLTF